MHVFFLLLKDFLSFNSITQSNFHLEHLGTPDETPIPFDPPS